MQLCPVLRPNAVSSSKSAMPMVNTNTKYKNRNVPPPYLAAKYGKRHMLPKPTAEAAPASTKASLFDHVARSTVAITEILAIYRIPPMPRRDAFGRTHSMQD